jgi:hypothetical protein
VNQHFVNVLIELYFHVEKQFIRLIGVDPNEILKRGVVILSNVSGGRGRTFKLEINHVFSFKIKNKYLRI